MKKVASLIEGGAYTSEVQEIYRVMILTMKLRSKLKALVLSTFWPNFVKLNECTILEHSRIIFMFRLNFCEHQCILTLEL